MIYTPPWLERAREVAQLGVLEIPGPEHHPLILEFGKAVNLEVTTDEIPWCSNFVNWCFAECDLLGTHSARARSWLHWGTPLPMDNPAFGCVVITKRGGSGQPGKDVIDAKGHVGFLIDIPTPTEVTLLGGNQSNQVCERTYPIERVLDYRWLALQGD